MDLFSQVVPMQADYVREMLTWRYNPPYDSYNFNSEDREDLLSGRYRAVQADDATLSGFYCFGVSARIPMGETALDPDYLDIGLGLRPDLCGGGQGERFVRGAMTYARAFFGSGKLRLAVAQFNQRAQKVYIRAGFCQKQRVLHMVSQNPFLIMETAGSL